MHIKVKKKVDFLPDTRKKYLSKKLKINASKKVLNSLISYFDDKRIFPKHFNRSLPIQNF